MKKLLLALGVTLALNANAEMLATLPNKAGGKIVLTDEICVDPVTKERYDALKRAYNYSAEGGTSEGCYFVEDESVVVVWVNSQSRDRSRYPLENFTFNKNYSKRKGTM
jgi:hypothetical protein